MHRVVFIILLQLIAWPAISETASSTDIARTAAEICDRSSPGYRLKVGGQLDAGARATILRKLLGAEVDLEGNAEFEAWEGVQQVLREHQLAKSINDNECIRELVPRLLDFELERLRSENQRSAISKLSELAVMPKNGEQPCIPLSNGSSFPFPVFKDMCLTDPSGARLAVVIRADPRAFKYSNANGSVVTCYPGDECGFGWKNSPVFSLSSIDGNPILVSIW